MAFSAKTGFAAEVASRVVEDIGIELRQLSDTISQFISRLDSAIELRLPGEVAGSIDANRFRQSLNHSQSYPALSSGQSFVGPKFTPSASMPSVNSFGSFVSIGSVPKSKSAHLALPTVRVASAPTSYAPNGEVIAAPRSSARISIASRNSTRTAAPPPDKRDAISRLQVGVEGRSRASYATHIYSTYTADVEQIMAGIGEAEEHKKNDTVKPVNSDDYDKFTSLGRPSDEWEPRDTWESINPSMNGLTSPFSSEGAKSGEETRQDKELVWKTKQMPIWHRAYLKAWGAQHYNVKRKARGNGFKFIVESSSFDYVSACFIILNAVTLGIQTDYAARHLGQDLPPIFRIIEVCFCIVFTTELILRFLAYGRRFFTVVTWKWNIFDCFVVFMQLFEEFVAIIAALSGEEDESGGTNFSALRILRVLRLVRIIRLVRIMHLIGELRILIASIFNSLRSLFWTLLLLIIVMYIVGVYFCQVVSDHLSNSKTPSKELQAYYGNLPRVIVSLFQAITNGVSWKHMSDPLEAHISLWYVFLICAYIAFALLALLNIITGVFVENSMKSAKKDDDLYLLTHSRCLFQMCCDDDGLITWESFEAQLANPDMHSYFRAVDLSIKEAHFLFDLIDLDESGGLQPDEFVNGCLRLRGNAKALDQAVLNREVLRTQRQLTEISHAIVWMMEKMDPDELDEEHKMNTQGLMEAMPQMPNRRDDCSTRRQSTPRRSVRYTRRDSCSTSLGGSGETLPTPTFGGKASTFPSCDDKGSDAHKAPSRGSSFSKSNE